jgi:site-specific DNA recombinase
MTNAVIYARVSTEEQGEGYSLSTQIEACQKYAINKNYQVLEIFQDKFTGTSVNRPALDELEQFVRNNDIQKIIVYDIDRFSRDSDVFGFLNYKFKKINISIEYVKGDHNDTPSGKMVQNFMAAIAGYEKEQILERMKRGKQGKAKSGSVIVGARPPYGYRRVSEGKKVWFEIDQEEAKIVQLVFRLYVNQEEKGETLSQIGIAKKLTEMKILTRGDKNQHVAKKLPKYAWQPATIRRILTRGAYTGTWFYGKTIMKNGKQVARKRSEWIPVEIPAIINRVDFDLAQARMKLNKELSIKNTKHQYLMGRRLKCSKCGYSYVGRTRREDNQYYYCKGKEQRPTPRCDMPQLNANHINQTVWAWIENILLDPSNLAEGLKENQNKVTSGNNIIQDQIDLIIIQINKNKDKINKLLDLYLEGEINKSEHASKKTEYNEINSALLAKKLSLQAEFSQEELTESEFLELKDFILHVRNGLKDATFETKRRIIDLFDVRGKLAVEDNQRIIYISCKITKPQRSLVQTSHSLNTGG